MPAFGPVPSRRFGRSLGVNNIPPKGCTYSCVYCQLGSTPSVRVRRRPFLWVQDVVAAVQRRVAECRALGEPIDYLTFVPDGEPTLDQLIGAEIRALKPLGIPVAVVTNGSLLWRPDVRADLAEADVVSVKVDTTHPKVWRLLNRPGRQLRLPTILEGVTLFAAGFPGEVWTETMLVDGLNDDESGLEELASFLEGVGPARAYLAAPTRPPARADVRPPSPAALVAAHEIFRRRLPRVELLTDPEEGTLARGADPVAELLEILAVHPVPERVARTYLRGSDPGALDELIRRQAVRRAGYRGESFVVRRWEGPA